MFRPTVTMALWLVALVVTQGCSTIRPEPKVQTFSTYGEAGRVIVGAQTVAPFEEYIDLLQPKFPLSPTDALTEAIPQTQSVRTRELRELLLALQLAFPVAARSETTTTSSTGESTHTTTKESSSPEAPAVAIPETVGRSLEALSALDATGAQTDAMLKYRAATALYQEVALLSSYLRDAAVSRDTVPYIVRQLVKVQPNARRAPYDAHLVLGYFAGDSPPIPYFHTPGELLSPPQASTGCEAATKERASASCARKSISVIPLFVTDSIETSLIQADRASLRDVGFASGGTSTAVGFGVGARSREEVGEESVSRELNSILTIGRAADNVLTMRIGAAFVENTYHLVARTYNITLLVLVPFDHSKNQILCPQVRVSIDSEFRDARTGRALPRASLQEIGAAMAKLNGGDGANETRLLETAVTNRFEEFRDLLCQRNSECSVSALHRMWVQYVREAAASGIGSDSIDLPSRQLRFFPMEFSWDSEVEEARNAVFDDGKSAVLRIEGGYGLTEGTIEAKLRFHSKGREKEIEFLPSAVKVDDGRSATVTFPSVHKVDPKVAEATVTLLYSPPEQRWLSGKEIGIWRAELPIVTYKKETAKKLAPEFELLSSSDQIRATTAGQGQLAVTFKRARKPTLKFSTVFFSLYGGHVVSATPELNSSRGAYRVDTDTIYTLNLGGLVPGSKLRLEAWRLVPKKNGKAGETSALSVSPVEMLVVGPEPTERLKNGDKQ